MSIAIGQAGFTVDAWDPGYSAALAADALAELGPTSAELDLDVELLAADWRPVSPAPDTAPPGVMLIADGVRRIDARVWSNDAGAAPPSPGIAASYAAGIVRCTPGEGAPAELAAVEVRRSLFTASPYASDIKASAGTYRVETAADDSMEGLSLALQQRLTQLEVDLSVRCRDDDAGDGDLLIVDGPLRGRTHLPRTVGYIKTHHTAYLPAPQAGVVSALGPGQRTPVFLMGTSWRRHAWYLALPVRSAAPWAGIVRCEAGADMRPDEVVELADAITLALPSLAGVDYKDPRAPQNLVPIGGLEKLLRHRLGDPRLLYRSLRAAAGR
ncbi:hypothetical protein GCM10023194_33080 [Planotetraspora phitsanulokensis]|uniref:NurA domain-containing protein n=1 Tax=Planotetraspora phitsanulokensis TaxID=575192 RepID=A0A8J3U1E9_9ACTN|nr:hypothetical protein [Planotetraspora phitsanulokensis]GII36564.1 hypothetical protein Pph01_15670 [Planotetraspora phitsanulokensis]